MPRGSLVPPPAADRRVAMSVSVALAGTASAPAKGFWQDAVHANDPKFAESPSLPPPTLLLPARSKDAEQARVEHGRAAWLRNAPNRVANQAPPELPARAVAAHNSRKLAPRCLTRTVAATGGTSAPPDQRLPTGFLAAGRGRGCRRGTKCRAGFARRCASPRGSSGPTAAQHRRD